MSGPHDDRHRQLGAFLRARRGDVSPSDVGLSDRGGRRRTSGLRREEVATLSDVSASWYTWLEQGRSVQPSRDVLDSVARALRLTDSERRHVFELAGLAIDGPAPSEVAADELARVGRVMALLAPAPAYATTALRDVVAWNEPMTRLVPGLSHWSTDRRNLLWMVWCEPEVIELLVDADRDARRLTAEFRADSAAREHVDAPAIIERISATNPEFRTCWEDRAVQAPAPRVRRFLHPWAGALRFETQELQLAGHPNLRLTVHLPLEGDDSVDRLSAWPTLP